MDELLKSLSLSYWGEFWKLLLLLWKFGLLRELLV
jgi:hypothetical protein